MNKDTFSESKAMREAPSGNASLPAIPSFLSNLRPTPWVQGRSPDRLQGGRGVQRGLGGESKLPPVPLASAERVPLCDFRRSACLFRPQGVAGSRFRGTRIVAQSAPCDSRRSACLFPPLAAAGSRFRETRIVAHGAPCDSRRSACLFRPQGGGRLQSLLRFVLTARFHREIV